LILIFDCFFVEEDEEDFVGVDFLEEEEQEDNRKVDDEFEKEEEEKEKGSGSERPSKYFFAFEHQNELIQYPIISNT
jgi:hypothetical protein